MNDFGSDVAIGAGSGAYTAGGTLTGTVSSARSIPANRYFLLGITSGPYYRAFKTLSANRTATSAGSPVFTIVNKFWHGAWPGGPTFGIPSQLGGAQYFAEYDGYVPVTSFIFTN